MKLTIKELQKNYNDFVDSLELGDLHLSDEDIDVERMWEKREWIRKIRRNIDKLERRFNRVYEAHTIELEHYVTGLRERGELKYEETQN